MGTINYKTNKILLTLATPFYYPSDEEIENETEFQNEEENNNFNREEIINILIDNNNYWIENDFNNIKKEINNLNFEIYEVKPEPGYYEGFSIYIKMDYIYFYDTNEKKQAQKELTKLKKLLINLVNNYNICVCFPGWCTSFLNRENSIKEIRKAIKPERERLKQLKTEKNYDFKKLFNY